MRAVEEEKKALQARPVPSIHSLMRARCMLLNGLPSCLHLRYECHIKPIQAMRREKRLNMSAVDKVARAACSKLKKQVLEIMHY